MVPSQVGPQVSQGIKSGALAGHHNSWEVKLEVVDFLLLTKLIGFAGKVLICSE